MRAVCCTSRIPWRGRDDRCGGHWTSDYRFRCGIRSRRRLVAGNRIQPIVYFSDSKILFWAILRRRWPAPRALNCGIQATESSPALRFFPFTNTTSIRIAPGGTGVGVGEGPVTIGVSLFIGQLLAPLRITDDFGLNHFKYHSCDLTIGVISTLYFFFLSALLTTKDTFLFPEFEMTYLK